MSTEEEQRLLAELDPTNIIKGVGEDDEIVLQARQDAYDLVVALLDTGARYSEIAKLPLDEIGLQKRQVMIWRTKVENASIIPMTNRLHAIFKRRLAAVRPGQVYLFENKAGGARNYASTAFISACRRLGSLVRRRSTRQRSTRTLCRTKGSSQQSRSSMQSMKGQQHEQGSSHRRGVSIASRVRFGVRASRQGVPAQRREPSCCAGSSRVRPYATGPEPSPGLLPACTSADPSATTDRLPAERS